MREPLRLERMFVDHLQLVDFRSYAGVDVALGPGSTTFVGANGQGKTNLVEAVEYLSTMSSHRVSSDVPLVRAGAERAVVRARVQAGLDDPRQLQLEVEITPGKANRARLNRSPLRRAREIVGVLRTVVFSPEDLAVVKGDPSERRRFLDDLRRVPLAADGRRPGRLRPGAAAAQHPAQVAERAAAAAVRLGATPPPRWTCGTPTSPRPAAELLEARLITLADLVPHVAKAYADIAPTNNDAAAEYKSRSTPVRAGREPDAAGRGAG